MVALLFTFTLVGVSGCSDSKCDQAKIEAQKAKALVNDLNKSKASLEKKLYSERELSCASVDDDKPLVDQTVSETLWRAVCRDWEKNNRDMTEIMANDYEAKSLNQEIIEAGKRWALTVTTYKDCFDASTVMDATEILSRNG